MAWHTYPRNFGCHRSFHYTVFGVYTCIAYHSAHDLTMRVPLMVQVHVRGRHVPEFVPGGSQHWPALGYQGLLTRQLKTNTLWDIMYVAMS